jgi:hypothetical protein
MNVGFNYPMSFNRYGADIGPDPHVDLPRFLREQQLEQQGRVKSIPLPPLFTHIDRNLENLKRMGIDVVRFFLLGNGFNYGQGPTRRNTPSPNAAAPFFDWDFTPPSRTDERFKFHFEELLKRFKKADMKIIPSLIDFMAVGNSRGRDAKGLAPSGRADCIKDTTKRGTFLNTVLADLLMISRQFKDQIFAWEVMNEPLWATSIFGPLSSPPFAQLPTTGADPVLSGFLRVPEVTVVNSSGQIVKSAEDVMKDFLQEAIQLIENMGFESTVGHRRFQDILDPATGQFGVTGSRPQFHYYGKHAFGFGDPPQIKGQRLFSTFFPKGRHAFLGEFDSDLNSHGKPWPELAGKDTTLNRLILLDQEGCELALIWPDKAPSGTEDPIKLEQATRQAIVNFTRGKLPPANE